MESILNCPVALELAQRCKMGDVAAMEELAAYYLGLCAANTQARLASYEAKPDEENRAVLHRHLNDRQEEQLPAEAHMMWWLRAARFGNGHAEKQVGRLPYFLDYAGRAHTNYYQAFPWKLPMRSLLGRWGSSPERVAWGEELRNVGFPDLPAVRPGGGFSITFWPSPGVYRVSWLADYIPQDESGFGEESDYACLWLDEFFCPLAADRPEDIPAELDRMDRVRETYWQNAANSASGQKYQRRLRISKQLPWGRKWEEIAPLLGVEVSRT